MNNRWSDQGEIAPKPFDFVPFVTPVHPEKTVGHDTVLGGDYISGRLRFELEMLTHLFVSSGSYMLGEDVGLKDVDVIQGFYRSRGYPTVPGSSLKGLVRSVVESVTASCITATRADRQNLPIPDSTSRDGCKPENACPACSIFGRMSRMAKVRFNDLQPPREQAKTMAWKLKPLHQPHLNEAPGVYRTEEDSQPFKGRKFYQSGKMAVSTDDAPVEVLPQGTRLTGFVRVWNMTPAEMGALCFGLGLDGTITLKLGGGKPRCLGSFRTKAVRWAPFDPKNLVRKQNTIRVLEGEPLANWVRQYIQAAFEKSYLRQEQVESLRGILRFKDDAGECPPELY